MARPKRGNYATGEAGLARYKEALRKYLAKTKKTEVKKPEVKKPVAKKPVAKKPATKKPAAKKPPIKRPGMTKAEKQEMLKGNSIQDKEKALKTKTKTKKPVAKKPVAKKPVAKKPATTTRPKRTANQLKIKKAATTAQKAIKKATPVVKKAASTVKKKAGEAKQAVTKKAGQLRQAIKKGRAPAPKTPQQKAVSKAYRGTKKYAKTALKKGGKDLLKIGKKIIENPKSAIKGGLGGIATEQARQIINRRVDSVFAKRKGMSVDEYRAARKKALKGKGIISAGKKLINKVKGKSGESSITKNINKQKKVNNKTPNRGLKIKKTQYSSKNARKKQDFGAATGTKQADKRFATFREGDDANLKLQLERQKGNTETYSRRLSIKAKKNQSNNTTTTTKSPRPNSARAKLREKNIKRFGKAHVDRLVAKNKEFQAIKRIKDRKLRKKKREEYRQKYGR